MREWLITNGIGGYAASTDIGGMNIRRYHGLLIAPLNPPSQRKLILSKVDESIEIHGVNYNLFTNSTSNTVTEGYTFLKEFEKEIIPIYKFNVLDTKIEKSICMLYGKNAVIVHYKIKNQDSKSKFKITPLINNRDFHSLTKDKNFSYTQKTDIDRVQISFQQEEQLKINMCVKSSNYIEHDNDIFYNMFYKIEHDRGFDCFENHIVPGTFEIELEPNENKELTFVCSLDGKNGIDFDSILKVNGKKVIDNEYLRINHLIENSKLLKTKLSDESKQQAYKNLVRKYIIASDNFIVKRESTGLSTVIAGYPWFLDWGRDSLIAFEGILLMSNRIKEAEEVLLTYARSVRRGIVPNGFNEYDDMPLFNSADAALLLIAATGKYLKYTNNYSFVEEKIFDKLKRIITAYTDGTDLDGNDIYLDKKDYLISTGTPTTQNTWMDAQVNGKPVTPRNGKTVEINALWYNALCVMKDIAEHLNKRVLKIQYAYMATRCKMSFEKSFYNSTNECLYDVLGDAKIRPNQLFALSLPNTVLDCSKETARASFVTCTKHLLNKYGMRTLSPDDKDFKPKYEGGPVERDGAYHQGTTWPWLLELYYDALKNLISAEKRTEYKLSLEQTLRRFKVNVADVFLEELVHGNTLGSICEVYDGLEPHDGKGAFAQAWSVAAVFKILLANDDYTQTSE